jgi:hypothetical protein
MNREYVLISIQNNIKITSGIRYSLKTSPSPLITLKQMLLKLAILIWIRVGI